MFKFNKISFFLFTLLFAFSQGVTAQGVFFSEDFDGGIPAEWTAMEVQGDGLAFSNWEATLVGPTGAFAVAALASTTSANGWVIFDGDANCGGNQDAWLITPPVDCSDKSVVFLAAEHYYRKFNDNVSIMVGTDLADMANWNEIPLFENLPGNSYGDGATNGNNAANPDALSVNISEFAANTAGVYVAFRFVGGCDYSWQIDDMSLTDEDPRPENELRINSFFATSTAANSPLSQVDPIYFLADIQNFGSLPQTGVTLNGKVEFEGTEVFSADFAYGEIGVDSLAENQLFPESYTPTETGAYTVTYTLTADNEDNVPANNVQTYNFIVSDDTFARNTSPAGPSRIAWADGDDHTWAYGTHYHIGDATGLYSRYLSFNVGEDSAPGEIIIFQLYKWAEGADETGARDVDPEEREVLGFILYEVTGDEDDNEIITMSFTSLTGGENIQLEDDTDYLLNMEFTPNDPAADIEIGFARDLDYGAVNFLHGEFLGQIRESEFLTTTDGGDLSDSPFGTTTFGSDTSPALTWSIGDALPTSVETTLPATEKVEISPNPAVEEAIVSLDLSEMSNEVRISLIDLAGRKVVVNNLTNVQNVQHSIDVSNVLPGIYFVNVITDKGFTSRQLVVIK
ncbi:MAG: hypothetical protein ACI85O_002618 [Saprospiraceae bacterium]|jgi:hypothetical protein